MTKLLNLQDVKDRCRVGYSTLYRWRKSGAFPESIGLGKLLWSEEQLTDWENRHARPPPTVNSPVQRKRDENTFDQRQEAASAVLQRHADKR